MAEVSLYGVSKSFGDMPAVSNLSLTIRDGEFVVLLGPMGAGKTTTLRLIAGLETPESGRVTIGGRDMAGAAPASRDVAFVFQQYSLYPHLTVYENLAFPLRSPARRLSAEEIDRRVRDIAKMVRIDHKLENRSTRLSGGEMQRVAIGRALVRKPAIYLMDEPLSSLDAKLRGELRLELKRIQSELGSTLLYVTHDQIEAMTMADRIGILHDGDLIQVGTPREIYANPVNLHVAARLGQPHINLIPDGLVPGGRSPPGTKTIGARTEHLDIRVDNGHRPGNQTTPGGLVNAEIEWIEHLGDQSRLHMRIGGHKLVTLANPYLSVHPGDRIALTLKEPLYFGSDGQRLV